MRVLYWTGSFWPRIGGVEVLSMQFVSAMKARGHEFVVITSGTFVGQDSLECHNDIPIYRVPFSYGLINHDLKQVNETIQRVNGIKNAFNPDLVHVNSMDISIFFHLMTNKVASAPSLFTVHSLPPNPGDNNTLMKKMLCSAEWVTTNSKAMLRCIYNIANEIAGRSSMIYQSLCLPAIQPSAMSFDEPRLLCLGRVVKDKGFDLAIEAFGAIIDRFPSARLIIAGDGPEKTALERSIQKHSYSRSVEFCGWVSPESVPELINTSVAVIVPSRWEEPFGLVALQGAQMARPVVAARVGGLPEVVEDQKTGLLFDKDDSAALADRIMFLLEHPEAARQMGLAARRRVTDLFSFDGYIDAYELLYRKLAGFRRASEV